MFERGIIVFLAEKKYPFLKTYDLFTHVFVDVK